MVVAVPRPRDSIIRVRQRVALSRFRSVPAGNRPWVTWLLVLLAWTAAAVVVGPFVGRVLAQGGRIQSRPAPRPAPVQPPIPVPRAPLRLT